MMHFIHEPTFSRPSSPNTALYVPEGVEPVGVADGVSPRISMSADALYALVKDTASGFNRVKLQDEVAQRHLLHFVERTPLLGFKDDIHIQVIALSENESSLILYSASRIGHSDLGTNRKRIEQWLKTLNKSAVGA